MNNQIEHDPNAVTVDIEELREVLNLLNQAKKLHEGGYYEAHKTMDKAKAALENLILKAIE